MVLIDIEISPKSLRHSHNRNFRFDVGVVGTTVVVASLLAMLIMR